MRYMRWSFADLLVCPTDYLDVIVEESQREAREMQAHAAQARSRRR